MQAIPALLREIIEIDRRKAALVAGPIVSIDVAAPLREMNEIRARLREAAHSIYGRAPLRGENGPGRPTAVAA